VYAQINLATFNYTAVAGNVYYVDCGPKMQMLNVIHWFARKFLNKSLIVTAFSTVAMTMQECQMCQSFLCHRLSEPSFEPSLKIRQNEPLHHSVISIDSIIIRR